MKSGPIRILILGGGFGGVYTARHLEELFESSNEVQITLVSRDNYFVMTPLLFEAGSGILEPRHAVNPIRPLLHRTRFVEAEVLEIDLERKMVAVRPPHGQADELPYDHLVLALGGVSNTTLVPGAEHALTFKTLGDAIYLRNHMIQLFERAQIESDPRKKAGLLTIIVVGGGLVAVELAGELTSFLGNLSRLYPGIDPRAIRFDLLEAEGRIIPEMDEDLADYARKVLEARPVRARVRVNTRVDRIEAGTVHLPDGEAIASQTILMATGVLPSPRVAALPLEKDKKGRVRTEPTMRSKSRPEIWALGDCASIPDPSGRPYPMLAQHAIREAKQLAENLSAAVHGQPLKPFVYETKGTLAALGHFKGIGRVYSFKIRGFVAWWVWRSYYLFRMPRFNRRLRIVLDWTIALMFKNDIVQLDISREKTAISERPHETASHDGQHPKTPDAQRHDEQSASNESAQLAR